MRIVALVAALATLGGAARADQVLRLATVAPDGTAWAHVARDFAHDVELTTAGGVKVKWYFGGVAGNEHEQLARIQRGQLDGAAATVLCDQVAPSLKVTHVLGLIQSRSEAAYVLSRLRPQLDDELAQSGFVPLVVVGFGSNILLSRRPIRSLTELRRDPIWTWSELDIVHRQLAEMKLRSVPLPLEEGGSAYDEGKVDGFLVIPTAALAFQWVGRAHYFLDLRAAAFLAGCLVVSSRSFYKLSAAEQQALKRAGDKLARALEVVGSRQDELLVGGLLEKQGVAALPFDGDFRTQFFPRRGARATSFSRAGGSPRRCSAGSSHGSPTTAPSTPGSAGYSSLMYG